ncbi:MAG: LysR family transcriptional regulator [Methylobacterium sp.]|uniref:LysR family transcriptional regulator n=1 Tax=Methylobacterium sp. TaxID=409 RepID=UPI0025D132D7|nr:LysR family transcriptional regulator [Methylobacterium sp.]MBX9932907.1 LysR family transcriptional regulator [Methylobacterium sp.]
MSLAWDDFRLVKAIADRGGLTRAAESLGINHSTAFRRLAAIEVAVETKLFERLRGAYAPTTAGLAMIEAAGRMESDVAQFTRESAGRSVEPAGDLRITAPAGLVAGLLMPILADFSAAHPRIRLDVVASDEALNLSRRDADVAIRATDHPPATLVGRRLAAIPWAVYGLAEHVGVPLPDCSWICPTDSVGDGRFARFVKSQTAPDRVVLRLNTLTGLREAIEAGFGVGPLPCWDASGRPLLVQLSEPIPELTASLWLLTHPDLRQAARVRAFMDHVAEAFVAMRPALEALNG